MATVGGGVNKTVGLASILTLTVLTGEAWGSRRTSVTDWQKLFGGCKRVARVR